MPSYAPQLTKNWNIAPNLRRPYTSMADQVGWCFYENKTKMLAAGWTVKWSSNGTDGPTGPGNTIDRWSSIANIATRGTASATAQSWIVLQNTDGLQVLLAYQGATADVARITYSPGGLFVPQGYSAPQFNYQPTATDETYCLTGGSLVEPSTSQDRVMTIWTTTDSTQWSFVISRSDVIVNAIGVEKVISYCGVNVFDRPYVGYRHLQFVFWSPNMGGLGAYGVTPVSTPYNALYNYGTASWRGNIARVFTNSVSRTNRVGGGWMEVASFADGFTRSMGDVFFNDVYPALQGSRGAPCYPLIWSGEKVANLDGILGQAIDWWLCHTNQTGIPARGNMLPGFDIGDNPGVDPVRSNWCVALGNAMVRPWRNVAAAMLFS